MEWPATGGGSLIHLALMLVQHAMPILNHPNGQKMQECVMIEGSSLGGQGVGSKYNTRVVYFPVLKWHQDDDPLNDPHFLYYEGYFIEHVCEMLKKGKAMPVQRYAMTPVQVLVNCLCLFMKPNLGQCKKRY